MTRKEIVFLFCRLLGVYLFMIALSGAGNIVSSLSFLERFSITNGSGTTINLNGRPAQLTDMIGIVFLQLLPLLLQLAAAIGVWMFAGEIAKRVFDGVPDEVEQGKIWEVGREVRSLAFFCMGTFFLLQDSSFLLGALFVKISSVITGLAPQGYYYSYQWMTFARILLSLYLIFGNGGIMFLWNLTQKIDPRTRRAKM